MNLRDGTLVRLCAAIWICVASAARAINIRIEPCETAQLNGTAVTCDMFHVGSGTAPNGGDVSLSTTFAGGYSYTKITVTITAGSNESIGDVSIDADSAIPVELHVIGVGGGNSANSIGAISSNGSSASVLLYEANSLGAIGSVAVDAVSSINAGGSVAGVHCTGRIFDIVCGGASGDIISDTDSIDQIYNSTGDLGSSGSLINIRAGTIGYVRGLNIYANISGPTGDEYSATIGRIWATSGKFKGSVLMDHFDGATSAGASGIYVNGGDFDADVTMVGGWDFSSGFASLRPVIQVNSTGKKILSGHTIVIGDSLLGDSGLDTYPAFDLAAGGLEGQIIINANGGSGVWRRLRHRRTKPPAHAPTRESV